MKKAGGLTLVDAGPEFDAQPVQIPTWYQSQVLRLTGRG